MVEIINTDFELLGVISNYESLIFNRSWSSVGDFELHINKNKNNVDKLVKDNIIIVDKKSNKVGIIEDIQLDCNNTKTLIIKGKQLKGITNRRLTVTDTYDRVATTQAENIFKHYAETHMVDSYYNLIATPERNFTWMQIKTTQNRGISTSWQSRFEYLDTLFQHISEDTGLGWDIYIDLAQECAFFDVYEGKDKSVNQNVNPPVIFSDKKRNVITSKIIEKSSGSKNVGYALGKGEQEERPIILVGDTDSTDLLRKELLIDLGSVDTAEVEAEAEKKLADYVEVKSIEGTIYQIPNMEYEEDWDLGDIVTLETEGYAEDKRITNIKEIDERNEKTIEVTFGNKEPNLQEELRKIINKAVI